ncbi:MAG: type II toxin-antitoxin system HicA family toxin [Proteobacteria bacterium]|nr:type II toxin-antitoxin system HicA family toxin [Pseudomonadota bacterium]MDA1057972.1 type II toxin-antitoxin system HicA family toxin [Pseudomonadota bacterium]
MPLRPLGYREVRRRLIVAGWREAGTSGSHVKFALRSGAGVRTAIVPKHREIAVGTLRSILRQAGITQEEFENL